ncbi:MAG TPA: hypothetical protein GX734_02910 [Clostridiaceae bacterium]|nr:hypothetical protein [Clostridiaceae bacterium]
MSECDKVVAYQLPAKYVPGMVVRSRAGHDRGRLYIVVRVESEDYLLLTDGKKRALANAKRKNTKHVQAVGHAITSQELAETLRRKTCDRERDTYIRQLIRVWEETCAPVQKSKSSSEE